MENQYRNKKNQCRKNQSKPIYALEAPNKSLLNRG